MLCYDLPTFTLHLGKLYYEMMKCSPLKHGPKWWETKPRQWEIQQDQGREPYPPDSHELALLILELILSDGRIYSSLERLISPFLFLFCMLAMNYSEYFKYVWSLWHYDSSDSDKIINKGRKLSYLKFLVAYSNSIIHQPCLATQSIRPSLSHTF